MLRVVRTFTFLALVVFEDGGRARKAVEFADCIYNELALRATEDTI